MKKPLICLFCLVMPAIFAPLAESGAYMRVTKAHVAMAEEVINKYLHDTYAWDASVYQICIDEKKAMKNTCCCS